MLDVKGFRQTTVPVCNPLPLGSKVHDNRYSAEAECLGTDRSYALGATSRGITSPHFAAPFLAPVQAESLRELIR